MAGKPGCGGKKGRSGRKAGIHTHVIRVPYRVTMEWVHEMESLLGVLHSYRVRSKGKTTRNYVEINRLFDEISEALDKLDSPP